PLEAYRALREAKDEIATAQARRDFTNAIRLHVKAIADKYIVPGETADSALMFLPSEAVYAELHASFPNLVDEAGRARVGVVLPTPLRGAAAYHADGDAHHHPRCAQGRAHARAGPHHPEKGRRARARREPFGRSRRQTAKALRPGGRAGAPGGHFERQDRSERGCHKRR